jgi:serine/threonine protein phosphatase PrpC
MAQVDVTWAAATARGRREENQDRYVTGPSIFAVADGMGGHVEGAAASEAAVRHLAPLADGRTVTVESVRDALKRADGEIRRLGPQDGTTRPAGTTVAGIALTENGGNLYWAVFHVGDSRVYRWTSKEWEQISSDHSVVQELIDSGQLTVAAAGSHPQRNVITRALGVGPRAEADFTLIPVDGTERFLACSDGLTGDVSDERIAELMGSDADPRAIADALVAEAVANGGRDNVTVVVVHVHRDDAGAEPSGWADDDVEDVTIPRLPGTAGPEDGGADA